MGTRAGRSAPETDARAPGPRKVAEVECPARPCAAPDPGAQRRRGGVPSCGAQRTLRGRRGTEGSRFEGLGELLGETFQDSP